MRPVGAPAETVAEARMRITFWLTLLAAGCGANTTELPAARMAMALEIMVAAGLLEGVIAATTPKGAYSTRVNPLSPVQACECRSSTPGVRVAQRRFF